MEPSNTRPETLYDLMGLVAEAIETRPLNYYQGAWAIRAKTAGELFGDPITYKEACGTAYCRAGWMVALTEPVTDHSQSDIQTKAHYLLEKAGIPNIEIMRLFGGGAVDGAPGTRSYVAQGVKGVRDFMERHEIALRNAKLADYLDSKGRINVGD